MRTTRPSSSGPSSRARTANRMRRRDGFPAPGRPRAKRREDDAPFSGVQCDVRSHPPPDRRIARFRKCFKRIWNIFLLYRSRLLLAWTRSMVWNATARPAAMPTPTRATTPSAPRGTTRTRRAIRALSFAAVALAASGAALAQTDQPRGTSARASASVDFRIVVPETLRIRDGEPPADPTRQHTSRTVQTVEGRTIVTIARP